MSKITKQQLNPSLVSEIESEYQLQVATSTVIGGVAPSNTDFNINASNGNLTLSDLSSSFVPTAESGANVSSSTVYIDKYGVVDIHVSATLGFKTAGRVLFTLPVGYRPLSFNYYTVTACNAEFTNFTSYALIVTVDGQITLPSDFPSGMDIIIGNITFRTK